MSPLAKVKSGPAGSCRCRKFRPMLLRLNDEAFPMPLSLFAVANTEDGVLLLDGAELVLVSVSALVMMGIKYMIYELARSDVILSRHSMAMDAVVEANKYRKNKRTTISGRPVRISVYCLFEADSDAWSLLSRCSCSVRGVWSELCF